MLLVVVGGLQIWQWRYLSARVTGARLSRLKACLVYVAWSMVPALLVVLAFLGAIALEEGLGLSALSEPMARASPFIVGVLLLLGLLGSAAFAVACLAGAVRGKAGQALDRSR